MIKKLGLLLFIAIMIWACAGIKTGVKEIPQGNGKASIYVDDKGDTLKIGTNIGDIAPDLAYPNPNGDTLRLSSLRGNVVLVDFWASWCRPCRWENRNLIQTVKKFETTQFAIGKKWNGKVVTTQGFKVFNVSLDNRKASWEKAIKQDRLNWPWHVSDLKGWRSRAGRQYGVSSIPTNFLLDANGVIIGKNLRGMALDKKLESIQIKTKAEEK